MVERIGNGFKRSAIAIIAVLALVLPVVLCQISLAEGTSNKRALAVSAISEAPASTSVKPAAKVSNKGKGTVQAPVSSETAPSDAAATSIDGSDTMFGGPSLDEELVVGKVLSISSARTNEQILKHTGMLTRHQLVKVRVCEGALNGKEFIIEHELTDNPAFNVNVNPGQEVILAVAAGKDGKLEVNIADYHRAPVIYGLLAVFLIAFLVFGGKKGIKSLLGLIITVLLIGYILLPMSLQGFNPLITSVVICFLAGSSSILLIGGLTKKALAAVVGTVGGVIIAGTAAAVVISLAPLTGLSSEEAQILRGSVLVQQLPFYSGLLAAGMLIGALGVIMDVGISIASSVAEVARADSKLTTAQLYESGMNVGRDIMGTMTNTLILAYAGSALPLLLLASQLPTAKLINLDLFATEVASALSGSLGLLFTIPLTAFAAAKMMASRKP